MESDVPLDYAVFQLSPKRSRCELFVSYEGTTEKLASGLVKPFVTNLKVAEEQVALAKKSIKLDVERFNDAETWFTKGTLERFVRFVSTPEVLEMVNTFDAEMSQLETARKIYSQEPADDGFGRVGNGATVASDSTKKELLRAIDVRLSAVKQDLVRACSRASAAGFNPETVSGLQSFADHFGAHRLSEACSIFITNTHRRADLFNSDKTASAWKAPSDNILRSSAGSDMSLDDSISEQPKPSTCTSSNITSSSHHFSREPSPSPSPVDVDESESSKDKPLGSTSSATTSTTESVSTSSSGKPQLTRRLSVQERISLFENKAQVSPSTTTPTTTTTPTSTGGKPELRRLSSEVNLSTDKAVLRRWSGASDMSIDISGERKEPDGNANTPTPSPAPSTRTLFLPKSKDLNDPKSEEGNNSIKLPVSAGLNSKIPSLSGRSSVKDQFSAGLRPSVTPFGRTEEVKIENQSTRCPNQIESQQFGSPSQSSAGYMQHGLSGEGSAGQDETGNGSELSTKIEETLVGIQGERNNKLLSDQQVLISQFSDFQSRTVEGELDSATSEVEGGPLLGQQKWNSVGEAEKVGKNVFESLDIQTESQSMSMKTSGLLGVKFSGNGSGPNQVTKSGGRKESGTSGAQMGLTEKCVIKNQEAFPSMPMDQVQRVREPKGNQGVNDELKMKANELEKLFAAHKLRIPGDQSNSASRIRPTKTDKEVESGFVNGVQERKASPARSSAMKPMGEPAGSSSETEKLYSTPLLKSVDYHDYDVTPHNNVHNLGFSDDSKGKLYQKYMRKRDAKLREDWSSNRPEKEAQMKAMQESLEESRAEMKVKLSGSADKKLTEKFLGDSSIKSAQSKRVQPNKNISSPSTRQSTASTPRTPVKVSNSAAGRRRLPNDNPVAQSVPNFSDLRKENTKSSSVGSKPIRPVGRVHARKKSTSEDLLSVNEEKPRRSQLLRKNSASTAELNTSRNSDDADNTKFMSSKYHSEENEDYEEFSNGMEFKTLQRKGSAGSGMGVSKASVMGEAARNGHGFLDTGFGTEEMVDVTQNEEHDYETTLAEESTYIDNKKGRLNNASDKYGNSGYENNNALDFLSQAKSDPAADLPISMSSLFRSLGSTLDSPGESPGSWNTGLPNPFAYSHEILDIDASDSPPGSPDTLSQSEAEAARIRKKWGAAQKPVVGIDSSHTQSRKDLTKGLKRFLNFGRKNRASESLADWISVTTSEGDDSEDGRDIANRSSEDLRKSRMGFSQSHNSDEVFHESNVFNEQVQALRSSIPTPPSNFKLREEHLSESSLKAPKSFFSLSNFRSKANDSRPR